MIIKCPNCERRFDLQRKAPTTFHCPKCGFRAPFEDIINSSKDTGVNSPSNSTLNSAFGPTEHENVVSEIENNHKTHLVPELQQESFNEKTHVVPNLQPRGGDSLQVMVNGRVEKVINITPGRHTIGRLSSDSKATIKITPDINMSRIHGYLSSMTGPNGILQYILKPANQHNPIYINNKPVIYGTAALLRPNDVIIMGNTTMVVKM